MIEYTQAQGLWDVLGRTEDQQDNFVSNVASNLKDADSRVMKEAFCKFCLSLSRL